MFEKTYKEILCKTSILFQVSQSFQSYVTDMIFDLENINNVENSDTTVEKIQI